MTVAEIPVFEVEDKIQSHPDSSDVTIQGDLWVGEVLRSRPQRGAPNGIVYVTQGYWVSNPDKILERNLWATKMVKQVQVEPVKA